MDTTKAKTTRTSDIGTKTQPIPPKIDVIPDTVLMVRPTDFAFTDQTASEIDDAEVKMIDENAEVQTNSTKAIAEFDQFVEKLREKGVTVIVHDKANHSDLTTNKTPDSCFPNNWLSTETNGLVMLYPMFAPNRRIEKQAYPFIEKALLEGGFRVNGAYHLGTSNQDDKFLEGTGSMIIDRQTKTIYAARSQRTDENALREFSETFGYKPVVFDTENTEKSYAHTNMLMCIGNSFVVICSEAIKQSDRLNVVNTLKKSKKDIIEITKEQADKHCCGNILQLRSTTDMNKKFVVMSEKAFKGFTEDQKKKLQKHGEILYSNIDTIEEIGGASARSMMSEIYLPRREPINLFQNVEKTVVVAAPAVATKPVVTTKPVITTKPALVKNEKTVGVKDALVKKEVAKRMPLGHSNTDKVIVAAKDRPATAPVGDKNRKQLVQNKKMAVVDKENSAPREIRKIVGIKPPVPHATTTMQIEKKKTLKTKAPGPIHPVAAPKAKIVKKA
jgi:hypothetical protein